MISLAQVLGGIFGFIIVWISIHIWEKRQEHQLKKDLEKIRTSFKKTK